MAAAKQGQGPPTTASLDAASNRHAPALLLFWSAACGTAASLALHQHHVPPDLLLMVDATFWLAVVTSISLTEAWVKFRAPLLDRWVGVDVGRRVFRAQYAIEAPLALTAAATMWAKGGGSVQGALALIGVDGGALLAAAGGILLLELAWLFPALDLRGRQLIAASAAAEPERLHPQRLAYVAELRRNVAGRAMPPPQLHLLAVVLALTKAALLAAFVWGQLLALA